MPSIEQVRRSNAGAHLFNALTYMKLVDEHGNKLFFSRRLEWTERFIGLLLESRIIPAEFADELNDYSISPPISPPGSGLDGLLRDIQRDE